MVEKINNPDLEPLPLPFTEINLSKGTFAQTDSMVSYFISPIIGVRKFAISEDWKNLFQSIAQTFKGRAIKNEELPFSYWPMGKKVKVIGPHCHLFAFELIGAYHSNYAYGRQFCADIELYENNFYSANKTAKVSLFACEVVVIPHEIIHRVTIFPEVNNRFSAAIFTWTNTDFCSPVPADFP